MGNRRTVIAAATAVLVAAAGLVVAQQLNEQRTQAPQIAWSHHAATANTDSIMGIAMDAEDNCYVAGCTRGALTGVNHGSYDAVLMKFDAEGAQQWIRQFGGPGLDTATSVAVDAEGNCFVAGRTYSSIFQNVIPGQTGSTGADAYLIKYSADGEQLWGVRLGKEGMERFRALAVDGEGNCYAVGYTASGMDGQNQGEEDAMVAKFTSLGELLWVRQFGTPDTDWAVAAAVDQDGNIYIGGGTLGSMENESNGDWDMFIAKYDPDGEQLWLAQHGTSAMDLCWDLAIDTVNECFYTVGDTYGDFAGDYAGRKDGWVVQFDYDGNWLWGRQIGSNGDEDAAAVVADAEGCYVSGDAFGGPLGGTLDDVGTMFLTRFDIDGNREWMHQFGPAGSCRLLNIALDAAGNCTIVGEHEGDFVGPNQGRKDGFVAKVVHESNTE